MEPNRVAVVGSLVSDLVVWVDHLPRKGESQVVNRWERHLGGKGFNQAVTARRCGAMVTLIGRAGDDEMADQFLEKLDSEHIDAFVGRDAEAGTGMAMPMILPSGDNSIVLLPRANMALRPEHVSEVGDVIRDANTLLLQLEVPVETSIRAAEIAREVGTMVIFNPAPARDGISALIALSDWVIPNETEAAAIAGLEVKDVETAFLAAERILAMGARRGVIVTLGDKGCAVVTPQERWHQLAFVVDAVDPTGAGDAFCGAFAVALTHSARSAVRFGAAAGALAVTRVGAEPSLPFGGDVRQLERR